MGSQSAEHRSSVNLGNLAILFSLGQVDRGQLCPTWLRGLRRRPQSGNQTGDKEEPRIEVNTSRVRHSRNQSRSFAKRSCVSSSSTARSSALCS